MSDIPSPSDELLDGIVRNALLDGETSRGVHRRSSLFRVLRMWLDGEGLPAAPDASEAFHVLSRRLDAERSMVGLGGASDLERLVHRSERSREAYEKFMGRGTKSVRMRILRRRTWPVAALSMLGLTFIGVGVLKTGMLWHAHQDSVQANIVYGTRNGQRATITLPDGGTVALNVASRIEIPMDYMAGHRVVRLVGEGLFTVSHHTGNPLTVIAGTTTARVLGTSFVVRHYPTDTTVMVAVQDGKVAVGTTVVTANQLIEQGRSGVPHLRQTDAGPFSFATGTLTIDGLSLPAVIVELDRWYDADIRIGDPSLENRHMKGTFGAGSIGELEERLALIYDVRVVRDGRVLTLLPRR